MKISFQHSALRLNQDFLKASIQELEICCGVKVEQFNTTVKPEVF